MYTQISPISIHKHVEEKKSLNSHPSTLNLIIQRNRIRNEYCEGQLSIDGTRICDTLENTNSRVPAGKYSLTLVKCKHHARKMPCLNPNTPCDKCPKSLNSQPSTLNTTLPCYCPMLKAGNGIHGRLDGSILVGRYNCRGALIHPKGFFDGLYERIRKSISMDKTVTLTITDPPK